ncbi:hypothetical protein ILYODFUR_027946, partial [Ilyodon furcidens]
MDKDDKKPKTYVSTFRFALKPQGGKQKENGLGTTKRMLTGNKLRCSSAAGIGVTASKTSFKNSVASLTQTQCSTGHAGEYTCMAENSAGRTSSSALLQITEHGAGPKEIPTSSNHEQRNDVSLKSESHKNTVGSWQHREEKDKVIRDCRLQTKTPTSKGPPLEFLDPPEKVEVCVGQQARLH